jgi:signal transduction histidine kinase
MKAPGTVTAKPKSEPSPGESPKTVGRVAPQKSFGKPDEGAQIAVSKPAASVPRPAPLALAPEPAAEKADAPIAAAEAPAARRETPQQFSNAMNRNVEPQQVPNASAPAWSAIVPSTAEFRTLTENQEEGMVTRFVQNKLDLIFWMRPPEAPELVFGCLIEVDALRDVWPTLIKPAVDSSRYRTSATAQPACVVALLDDRARPMAMQPASAPARDWKRPFVASEIGEALPHWEAALYLASPTQLADDARGLRQTLTFLITGAIALIALGGWLVVADARRQLKLAQQKTDFVSNVSHELKTPLTSIRMFAELMQERPPGPEKQSQYLRIITVEAERLTRLINNVLDFARQERKQRRFEKKDIDLFPLIDRIWQAHVLHLQEGGLVTRWDAAPAPYPVLGDEDALAQVLVNLLSNAEKYSGTEKCVELHTWIDSGFLHISVLDCGLGVPDGEDRKIFEPFYRAHDSLSSGIQGSGLGLTLAQRVAHEHGGEITFRRREGRGSDFTLRLPLRSPEVQES